MSMFELAETAVPPQKEVAFHRLMSGPRVPVYVLGRNKYAQGVARAVSVKAFIDDFTTESAYMEKPIIRMRELPADCIVVSCVVAGNSLTALDRLESAGVREAIDYFTLSRLSPDVFSPVDYCARNRQDIIENATRYDWVYNLLVDDVSKRHFKKVVDFRLNMDVEHMRGFTLRIDEQYFEDFLPRNPAEVFVDGGGYDGKTTRQFVAWNKEYRRVYYFEPAPAMMQASRQNLSDVRDIRFIQKGLFSRNDRLRFDEDADQASSISPTGQTEIEVVRLDDEVEEAITFIKMDIEGSEYEALHGAANHIRREMPTIAVCIYHDQRDFWRIPLRVMELNDCYSLHVRHYTQGVHETVLFFVAQQ